MQTDLSHIRYAFIIGIGRSGTTLLSRLLNRHKHCMVSLEIELVIFFHSKLAGKKKFSDNDLAEICEFLRLYSIRHPLLQKVISVENLFSDLKDAEIGNFRDLTIFLHLQFNLFEKPLTDIRLLVDKNPSYTLHVDRLLEFAPEAKFIGLLRDYRANILSRRQSIEYRSPDTAFNSYRWLFYNRMLLRQHRRWSQRILLLKYEDLVSATSEKVLECLSFLGLDPAKELSEFYPDRNPEKVAEHMKELASLKPRYEKTLGDLERPVYSDRVDKWRTELPAKDIELAEVICGALGESLGYERSIRVSGSRALAIRIRTFPAYLKAIYDFRKEFILYHFSPAVKLRRIRNKFSS